MAQMLRAGRSVTPTAERLSEGTWRDLQRLMQVNRMVGGQLVPTLQRFAQVLRQRDELTEEIQIAATGPKASARLVMNLPILVFVGGAISGIPVFQLLTSSMLAIVSLVMGLTLYWIGSSWMSRIISRAQPIEEDPGFDLDVLAVAVGAGLPLGFACKQFDIDEGLIEFLESEVPTIQLLSERADDLRQQQHNENRKRIQRTSVAILWPLGVTVLPAFVLVAIVPLALAMMIT